MRPRQGVLAGVLVVVGLAVVLTPAVGAVVSDATTAGFVVQSDESDNETSTAEMGTQLSSFVQAQSAEANGSVDAGMWNAQFNRTDDKERAVQARTATLDRRLDRLQVRMDRLEARHENGTIPQAAYEAQASRLTAEIAAIQRAINDTDAAAREAGVNATQLDELRSKAANASGHEVAQVARRMAGPPTGVLPAQIARGDGTPGSETPGLGPPNETASGQQTEQDGSVRDENTTERLGAGGPDSDVPVNRSDSDGGPGNGQGVPPENRTNGTSP